MKKIFFFVFIFTSTALSTSLASCASPQGAVASQATATFPPPTSTPKQTELTEFNSKTRFEGNDPQFLVSGGESPGRLVSLPQDVLAFLRNNHEGPIVNGDNFIARVSADGVCSVFTTDHLVDSGAVLSEVNDGRVVFSVDGTATVGQFRFPVPDGVACVASLAQEGSGFAPGTILVRFFRDNGKAGAQILNEEPIRPLVNAPNQIELVQLESGFMLVTTGADGQEIEKQTVDTKGWVEATGSPLTIENLDAKKWGNYSLIESPDGYYEMKDVQGNLIPEVKLFRDGTAELTYSSKKLAVAFQAVSIGKEGQLAFGLWDYKNGEWIMAPGYTAEDVRAGEFADDYHKLVVIRGNDEIEKKLTDTIFAARDLYMNNTERYRPESEFEGITVTYNFKTVENFDVRPKEWQMQNFSRAYKVFGKTGVYRFSPSSMSNEVVYKDGSTLSYARPMQVGLSNVWFKIERYGAENNIKDPLIHVPIVSMNTNGSINNMSALVKESDLPRLVPFLNKEDRGGIDIWLFSKAVDQMPSVILSNTELMSFTSEINNRNFFDLIDEPKLDTRLTLKSLPKESSQAFFTLIIQTWY